MGHLTKDTFVCLDCEATGLDLEFDKIIELAAVTFNYDGIIDRWETLIDPQMPIPEETIKIHHITPDMVAGKPKIQDVLPQFLRFIGKYPIIGHGIGFDITMIANAAKRHQIPCNIRHTTTIDTLRLARLYGGSPTNSLEKLREHFNIKAEGAHRAMSDVIVNVKVFKHLTTSFKTTEEILKRLQKPVPLKTMPLGKHKGRIFRDIPGEYLHWAAGQKFDQDLLFSIRTELKKRKSGSQFSQSSSPFADL